ncbi:MAG: hypothetical protein ACQERC_03715 [Bacteroidota bacterium]
MGRILNKMVCIALLIFFVTATYGQTIKDQKPYKFMFGLAWNAIDDDGRPFQDLLRFNPRWNMIPAPTTLSMDYYLQDGMSLEGRLNFNRYKESNLVNNAEGRKGLLFNVDFNFKYSFSQLMEQPYVDPFVFLGVGYTKRPEPEFVHMFSPNFGVGFNVMLNEEIGIQMRTAGKFAVHPVIFKHNSNYLHHHFGVVYKMNAMPWNEDFSKKKYHWLFKNYRWKGNKM